MSQDVFKMKMDQIIDVPASYASTMIYGKSEKEQDSILLN